MKKFSTIVLTTLLLFMTSCATLFTGTKDRITFTSNPPGATIYLDGVELCRTLCTTYIKRSIADTYVEFKLDDYETKLIKLNKEFNIISVINLGNLFGWGIDALSGSVMKYDRKSYDITLDNKKTSIINPTKINIDSEKKTVEIFVAEN